MNANASEISVITQIKHADLPPLLSPLGAGFYAGLHMIGDDLRALIVAPKAMAYPPRSAWGVYGVTVDGANSYFDGLANTIAMAAGGSKIAQWARGLVIGGATDWAIPARDQLELLYRHCKPTAEPNCCSFRDGDNPSGVPTGYPYTTENPLQATIAAFQACGDEAFEDTWHWSSTQSSAYGAWGQDFNDGDQYTGVKDDEFAVRAVRTIHVIH